jgi:hypothetical protein
MQDLAELASPLKTGPIRGPETSVTATKARCVTSQKRGGLNYIAAEG